MDPASFAVSDADSVVVVERHAAVALIKLNRPHSLNAFSPELIVRLRDAWLELRDDNEVRVIVVTGAGDRAFSVGADLKQLVPLLSKRRPAQSEWDEKLLDDPGMVSQALLKSFDVDKPTIASINGLAIGGGFELVQSCDLRVMANSAKLALQEVQWGLFPAGGSTVDLPRQLPMARAMEMLLTGESMTAAEALHHGLVNRVESIELLTACAMAMAQKVAELSPTAVRAIRRSVRNVQGLPLTAAYAKELEIALPVFAAASATEGLERFANRRG
jgi:enoyl-CoA hydratase